MAFAPPLYIDTRTAAPRSRFGIIDAADEVVPEDRRFTNGIELQPICRMGAKINASECGDDFEFDMDGADGRPVQTVAPIRIYGGFTCRSVGLSQDDINREAEAALTFAGPVLLEQTLWSPPEDPAPAGPAQLRLMSEDTVVLGGGDAVGFVHGLRLLEDYLAINYGRVGVIHAPAGTSADAGFFQQIRWEAAKPVTQRGTRWSWGAYSYADPEGEALDPEDNTAWLVATGAVTLRQTPARVLGEYQQVLNRSTNEVFAIATKTYVVQWECVTTAVLVTLNS